MFVKIWKFQTSLDKVDPFWRCLNLSGYVYNMIWKNFDQIWTKFCQFRHFYPMNCVLKSFTINLSNLWLKTSQPQFSIQNILFSVWNWILHKNMFLWGIILNISSSIIVFQKKYLWYKFLETLQTSAYKRNQYI